MSVGFSRQFELLAGYNQWANGLLYGACGRLSSPEVEASRPAFFGSILGTLNHILVGDQAWLSRLRGESPPGLALNYVMHDALPTLLDARRQLDIEIAVYVSGLTEAQFTSSISYKNMSGVGFENLVADVLTHMFNHQTHHRGQVHDMLSQTDVPPPELDYIFFIRKLTTT